MTMNPIRVPESTIEAYGMFSSCAHGVAYRRIMTDHENDVYAAERRTAERLLALYREILSELRLHNHNIIVWANGCGYGIKVNGTLLADLNYRHRSRAIDTLQQIESTISRNLATMMMNRTLNY